MPKAIPTRSPTNAKRLPHPATHNWRGERVGQDPFDTPEPLGGMAAAEAYARWMAARDGIEIPRGATRFSIQATTCAEDEHDAVFAVPHRTYGRRGDHTGYQGADGYQYRDEEVARFRIPPHAVHYARCDLWHLARQGGATLAEAAKVAHGFRWNLTPAMIEASKPVKATAKGAAGKQESFLALLDTPARFVQAIRDEEAAAVVRRAEQEISNREHSIKWFEEGRAKALAEEGEDGMQAYEGYGRGDGEVVGWVAEGRRKDWMKAAREARDYGLDAERIAFCIARARLFSSHARIGLAAERAARAAYLAEHEARRAAEAARDFVAEAKAGVVCDTGQVTTQGKRQLERAVKRGELVKWRGYWFPNSGAPWGTGPLKTCYGAVNPYATAEQVAA